MSGCYVTFKTHMRNTHKIIFRKLTRLVGTLETIARLETIQELKKKKKLLYVCVCIYIYI
jgi:hypothetical protein